MGERGHRVLLPDWDPRASASAWLSVREGDRGLLDISPTTSAYATLCALHVFPTLTSRRPLAGRSGQGLVAHQLVSIAVVVWNVHVSCLADVAVIMLPLDEKRAEEA
jgi:hypothetical protein